MPVARRDAAPLGVVYTPSELARAMVELALAPLLGHAGARPADGVSSAELLALRICDPAMGEGAFLVEVVNVLAAQLARAWAREADARSSQSGALDVGSAREVERSRARAAIIESCIYGVDLDGEALAVARQTLGGAGDHLRAGDALDFEWERWPTFDLVIGNPPYIRQEHLAGKAKLRDFACYDGTADLYVYFLELAHRIAHRYCFVTPNKWLTVAYARPLRRFLANADSVEGVIDLGRVRVFANADAFPCVVWGGHAVQGPIRAGRVGSIAELADGCPPHHSIAVSRTHRGIESRVARGNRGAEHSVDRSRFATDEPWHLDGPRDRALVERLEARWPALGEIVGRPSRGIVTGRNGAFVIDRATRDRIVERDGDAMVRPFLKGRDVRRWRPAYAERYILLVDHGAALTPAIEAHLAAFRADLEPKRERSEPRGRKPGAYRWYELQDPVGPQSASRAPRMFFQDIQSAPAFCIDETGLVPDTTVWTLPTADRYLLAVLNSPVYWWYAQRRFPPALGGSVRPKHDYIRAFPIATPALAIRAKIEGLVERRLAGEAVDDAIAAAVFEAYEVDERELRPS